MNLKYIRQENQKKTLTLLKKGTHSCKEIAKLVGVSNVAMYDILEDFSKKNYTLFNDQLISRKKAFFLCTQ